MGKYFKIDVYGEYVYHAALEKWFAAVEEALGFKLFFWQKSYIAFGTFRRYGKTTAEILRELSQINEPPIDLRRYKTRGHRVRIYYDELLKMKETLNAAGILTRGVILSERDYRKWQEILMDEKIKTAAGVRDVGKFWDC